MDCLYILKKPLQELQERFENSMYVIDFKSILYVTKANLYRFNLYM